MSSLQIVHGHHHHRGMVTLNVLNDGKILWYFYFYFLNTVLTYFYN